MYVYVLLSNLGSTWGLTMLGLQTGYCSSKKINKIWLKFYLNE